MTWRAALSQWSLYSFFILIATSSVPLWVGLVALLGESDFCLEIPGRNTAYKASLQARIKSQCSPQMRTNVPPESCSPRWPRRRKPRALAAAAERRPPLAAAASRSTPSPFCSWRTFSAGCWRESGRGRSGRGAKNRGSYTPSRASACAKKS